MKNVLIIGANGYISSFLTSLLLQDPEVKLSLIQRRNKPEDYNEGAEVFLSDIRNEEEKVKEWLRDKFFDSVIDFTIYRKEDAESSVRLFNGKTGQFIFISTVVVQDHSRACYMNETVPYGNRYSHYGMFKEECERYFFEEAKNGFPITVVRPSQTYSKDKIPLSIKGKTCWSVVSRMLRGKEVIVHGDGQGIWTNTHALDFAHLIDPIIGNPAAVGEIYQVMNPEFMTWDQMYQTLADVLGVEYKPVYISTYLLDESKKYYWKETIHGDKHFSSLYDISKLRALGCDYRPQISLKEGYSLYMEYMKAHPEKQVEDEVFDAWCDQVIEKYKALAKAFTEDI